MLALSLVKLHACLVIWEVALFQWIQEEVSGCNLALTWSLCGYIVEFE